MSKFQLSASTIRDAQERLNRLGHDCSADPAGVLADHTAVALQAFQRQRGLTISGTLDAESWALLVEAGWVLGSRLLFLTSPHLRGDDVAALQEALALLGFNPGRIDGIFGRLTERALAEFQRNCALEPSGVLTRASLDELERLSSRASGRRPVTETHDAAGLPGEGRERVIVVAGECALADEVAREVVTAIPVARSATTDVHASASYANEQRAALVLSCEVAAHVEGVELLYYESYRAHSVTGRALAHAVAQRFAASSQIPVRVSGMSLAILRETLMPALAVITSEGLVELAPQISTIVADCAVELFDKTR
jgi:N-acetylmuramoyl-L-alanine amidase